MNILFLSPNSPYTSIGGTERHILNLIHYYESRTDTQVHIVLPTTGKNTVTQQGSVTLHQENTFFVARKAHHPQQEIARRARLFTARITRIIRDQKIDIICAENIMFSLPTIYSLQLNMVATLRRVPLVLRLHSFATTPLQSELITQLMWNKVSCVSQSVAGDCFQKGCDIDVLSTDYLGVDTNVFHLPAAKNTQLHTELGLKKTTRIIMTASRIVVGTKMILEKKGIINLIRAFSKMNTRYPDVRLLIAVGNPTQNLRPEFDAALEMLHGYIKLHGVESQTIVRTFSLDEMPHVYQGADVFVLASENETFGQVYIEAMSSGVPVIGTKVGGIPEIISDSYSGFLIQPNDASVLAQRIERLLQDEPLRRSFIAAGIKTVANQFTAQKQFDAFHRSLEQTVAQNKLR